MEWENKMHSFNLSAAVLERCVTQDAAEDRSAIVKDDHLVHVLYSMEKQHMRIQKYMLCEWPNSLSKTRFLRRHNVTF